MTQTLETPLETKIVATLVMKASGINRQRVRISRGRVLDFIFKRGIGHVIEYTDLGQFHKDEAELRALVGIPLNIRTIIGSIDEKAKARSAITALIADTKGHRPTKHQQLCELRTMLDAEIVRLEKQGIGKQAPPADEPTQKELSPREQEIENRKAFLRRAGEEHVRNLVKELQAQGRLTGIRLLGNYQGMMDAVIGLEFPASLVLTEYEPAHVARPTGGALPAGWEIMPIDGLRELAAKYGITERSRSKILTALEKME